MSPGGTMMRVYSSLKARIMDGEFVPGIRIDPARLGEDLAASTTPVRDALHRLTGEGLIESWQNEGFRITHVSEPALRDIYEWSRELTRIALRAPVPGPDVPLSEDDIAPGYAHAATACLVHVASLSPNHEVRRAMHSLCDRAYQFRPIELQLIDDAAVEVAMIEARLADHDWVASLAALDRFHGRRMALVSQIVFGLRERAARQRI